MVQFCCPFGAADSLQQNPFRLTHDVSDLLISIPFKFRKIIKFTLSSWRLKVGEFTTIQISDVLKVCPGQYIDEEGDIPGWGSELGSKISVRSIADCASRCDEKPLCLSFEQSDTAGLCNLNKEALPSVRKYKDYTFCRKSGNNSAILIEHD